MPKHSGFQLLVKWCLAPFEKEAARLYAVFLAVDLRNTSLLLLVLKNADPKAGNDETRLLGWAGGKGSQS